MAIEYKQRSSAYYRAQVRSGTEEVKDAIHRLIQHLHLAEYPPEVRHHAVQARKQIDVLFGIVVGSEEDEVHVVKKP